MKDHLFPVPPGALAKVIEELQAERRTLEILLDATPYVRDQPHALVKRRHKVLAEIERREARGDGGPLLAVTLDAYASAIVRRILREEAHALAVDVVNSALTFTHGEADDHDADRELEAAIARRQAGEERRRS